MQRVDGALPRGEESLAVIRVYLVLEDRIFSGVRRQRAAQPFRGVAELDSIRRNIEIKHDHLRCRVGDLEPLGVFDQFLLALAQRVLGVLARGHVIGDTHHAQRAASPVTLDHFAVHLHEATIAAGIAHPRLHHKFRRAALQVCDGTLAINRRILRLHDRPQPPRVIAVKRHGMTEKVVGRTGDQDAVARHIPIPDRVVRRRQCERQPFFHLPQFLLPFNRIHAQPVVGFEQFCGANFQTAPAQLQVAIGLRVGGVDLGQYRRQRREQFRGIGA